MYVDRSLLWDENGFLNDEVSFATSWAQAKQQREPQPSWVKRFDGWGNVDARVCVVPRIIIQAPDYSSQLETVAQTLPWAYWRKRLIFVGHIRDFHNSGSQKQHVREWLVWYIDNEKNPWGDGEEIKESMLGRWAWDVNGPSASHRRGSTWGDKNNHEDLLRTHNGLNEG